MAITGRFSGFSWLLATACLVLGGSASAGPFAGGEFGFKLGALPELTVPITQGFTTSGGGVTATSTGAISGVVVHPGLTNAPPITRFEMVVTGNQTGSLVPAAGTAANPLGLQGALLAPGYGGYVTLLGVPLTPVGVPGATFNTSRGGGTVVAFTGAGWTTGTVMVTLPSTTIAGATGQPPGVVTAAGTNMLVGGVGQITFISPLLIRTNLAGDLPSFARLTLTFVPEPGSLLLIGAGTTGLAVYGRRRAANAVRGRRSP